MYNNGDLEICMELLGPPWSKVFNNFDIVTILQEKQEVPTEAKPSP